ncbi:caspase family protein [Exiguobacterium sp. s192]|uniref:caspase family protein n=1 Tax=Exiguobacterium sp. s192 TaxID=2751206 RepID=UPI001BE77961|nr:caspase family protein [Exiguobacterium sp. s192]
MLLEKRYAIVIGINDYTEAPLNFCVNDALSIEQTLIDRCRFESDNVFTIISGNENPLTEITGKYKEALRNIKEKFKENEDSILFYFAGHGNYKEDQSNVFFHDSEYPIFEIYNEISSLNPKVQTYIIDSCNSGGKVLTRSQEPFLPQDYLIGKYIDTSDGAMLVYACGSDQTARETAEMKHGLLTYELLNVINNDKLYDEDGVLTPSIIQDNVLKQTTKNSNFEQIPVVENRIVGIYPFAVIQEMKNQEEAGNYTGEKKRLEIKKEIGISSEKVNGLLKDELVSSLQSRKISYTRESRIELQEQINKILSKKLSEDSKLFISNNPYYEIDDSKNINELDFERVEKLNEIIILNASKKKISPLNNIFEINKRRNPSFLTNSLSSIFKTFSSEVHEKVPEFFTDYIINIEDEYIQTKINIFYSENILSTSFGVGYLIYQSKWGIILTTLLFKVDWNGEKDNIITNVRQSNHSFLIESETNDLVTKMNFNNFSIFDVVSEWNSMRKTEIENFVKISNLKD